MILSPSLIKSTIVAALGGLLFGFDTAVIAGTTSALTRIYSLSELALGFTVASALCGTILGAMTAGIPGNRYGRRDSLRCMAVFYVVSAFGCAFAWDWYSLLFFPFIAALSKPAPFMFFSAMMALQFLVVLIIYPETKGETLEETQRKLSMS